MDKQMHTEGPWKVDGLNVVTEHPADIGIAKMYHGIGQPTRANARLIAAAPDLLAACESAWEAILENTDRRHGCATPAEQVAIELLRAAISRAKGE